MSAALAVAPPVAQLGRFRLLRELGRGAQAVVWLAHDPRLDRDVALKLLEPMADPSAVAQWLHEARAVSRLNHPNIVPVFEADEAHGQSYLVFEYVEGPTLAQSRRGQPPMPPREAVGLMLGVLDALAAAHEQGLVHRDLKPSNVLLGRDGRARVMDFGIAARVSQADGRAGSGMNAADGRVVGTPGYMSPEAARGESPVPAMDVFSAGIMLGELLSGGPLMRETDPYRAIERVQHEDLTLPAHAAIDPGLRGIVQRALSRELSARYDGARSLHAALSLWLQPETLASAVEDGSNSATLEFLLRRMRRKTDFPALSSSVVRIQRLATSETESLRSLTEEILKDVALTNKLLRMVNTAHFTAVAGEGIATVSRAVALVGFAGIRNMALSLVLLEHMQDKVHAAQLKDEFLRALMAGTLAEELAPLSREGEEAFLGAMFQNLGRLLTEFYLLEEAQQIRQQLPDPDATPAARSAASRQVLGLSFEDLGVGVAKAWGLPEGLQRAMRAPEGEVPSQPLARGSDALVERQRWLGRAANALADAWLVADAGQQGGAVAAAASLFAPVLGLSSAQVVEGVHKARARVGQLAHAMGIRPTAHAPARRLVDGAEPGGLPQVTLRLARPTGASDQMAQALAQAHSAIAQRGMRVNEVLHLVLDTLHRALAFRCVVFCLREGATGRLQGRVGLGPGSTEISAAFRVDPNAAAVGDLFAVLCAKGADLLVADSASMANRLPAWYRQQVNAATFLLLPVRVKDVAVGLIYADKAEPRSIVLAEDELKLIRALRDLVAAAFGKAG